MVQYTQILTANGSAFLLLTLLKLIMHRKVKLKSLLDARLLSVMINLTMFQCFFDTLVFWIDGKTFPMARELTYLGNIMYYIINVTVSYIWPLFTEYKLNSNVVRLKKLAILLGIPLVFTVILVSTTPLNGFIFTVTADNRYVRTGLNFLIPTLLIVFYLLFGTIQIHWYRRSRGKYMLFPAIYFVTPTFLAVTIQAFCYGTSFIFIGTAIGITGIYLSTQSESAYIDQLCGVYNRRYYSDYIRAFFNSKNKGSIVTGVLIDMDNFKPINDNFGHETGDEALVSFSSVLRRHMRKIGFVVRYGGDEFILLTSKTEQDAVSVVRSITEEIDEINYSGKNKYKLAFSYGIATVDSDSTSDDFLNAMDSRMYEMKRARKVAR